MHTFKVVREDEGWAVRVGDGMSTPFYSRTLAIREAHGLCDALRRHGEAAEVVVEELDPDCSRTGGDQVTAARLQAILRRLTRPGR